MFKKLLLITAALLSINSYALDRSATRNLTQHKSLKTVDGDILKVKFGRVTREGSCTYIATYICESIKGEACEEEFTRIRLVLDFSKGVKLVQSRFAVGIRFDVEKSEGLSVELVDTSGSVESLSKINQLLTFPGDDIKQIIKDYNNADNNCYAGF